MKRNFNELFSKMKPAAQERVKARSNELLQEITLLEIEGATTPSPDSNSSSSEESSPQRASANRKVALQGTK